MSEIWIYFTRLTEKIKKLKKKEILNFLLHQHQKLECLKRIT